MSTALYPLTPSGLGPSDQHMRAMHQMWLRMKLDRAYLIEHIQADTRIVPTMRAIAVSLV